MTYIPSSFSLNSLFGGQTSPQSQASGTDNTFEALLLSFEPNSTSADSGDPLSGIVNTLFDKIAAWNNNPFSALFPAMPPQFPFSSSFDATFGVTGPLPDYITMITASLKLTATQNQSLQDICVENKDVVKSNESVQKIAMELQAAGIGVAVSV